VSRRFLRAAWAYPTDVAAVWDELEAVAESAATFVDLFDLVDDPEFEDLIWRLVALTLLLRSMWALRTDEPALPDERGHDAVPLVDLLVPPLTAAPGAPPARQVTLIAA
jgi:hypothetical protein